MQKGIKIFFAALVLLSLLVCFGAGDKTKPGFDSGLPAGTYGGARQLMVIGDDGVVRYPDNLGLDSIVIDADGSLAATFPTEAGSNAALHLRPSAKEHDLAVWTSGTEGRSYKATAIPHSEETYSFRLEILRDGKLLGGAQVFCAICKPKLHTKK